MEIGMITELVVAFLIIYVITINAIGFALMKVDKQAAQSNQARVPEATIFKVAVVGGIFGVAAGMLKYRHKTQKKEFQIVLEQIFAVQLFIAVAVVGLILVFVYL